MSTLVFSTAGLTMAKVGKGHPVSYSAHTPSGSIFLPSSSKQTVTILYVGKALKATAFLASIFEDEEGEGEGDGEAITPFPDGEETPASPCEAVAAVPSSSAPYSEELPRELRPASAVCFAYGEDKPCEGEGWEGAAPSRASQGVVHHCVPHCGRDGIKGEDLR